MSVAKAIALVVALTLPACAGDPSPSAASSTSSGSGGAAPEVRTYRGDGFSFSYPSSWIADEPATGLVQVVIAAPADAREDGVLPNINLVVEPIQAAVTTDQYFAGSKHVVSDSLAGFDLVDEGTTTVDGEPALWMEYRWTTNQGVAVGQHQVYQARDGTGYVITLTSAARTLEEQVASQLIVETSFRIT